jgi:hypothetical protein
VLVDDQGEPVLIDIEGLMFFDVEWEHTFLQPRYGEHDRWLRRDHLDEARFYRLAMHLSLVAGPLRLLDGNFPDRESDAGHRAPQRGACARRRLDPTLSPTSASGPPRP